MTAEHLIPHVALAVKAEGRFVEVTVGTRAFTLDYDTAFRFAVLVFGNAKIAKANAGNRSPAVYGFANLTDGVLEELKAQRNRDGTAGYTLRP